MKIIPLTQGKFAMVDDADFERLNQWKWYANWDGLGSFKTAIEAAKAYNVAALKRYGEFSILNDLSKYETTEKQTAGTA